LWTGRTQEVCGSCITTREDETRCCIAKIRDHPILNVGEADLIENERARKTKKAGIAEVGN